MAESIVNKKIARLFAQLPPEFLLSQALTYDQIEHWQSLHRFYSALSSCWKALHQGSDDPLTQALSSGEIDRTDYDYIWLTVNYYQRLWELVQISFPIVKPELERILGRSPKTALEIFEWILRDSSIERFSVCLEPYVELSARKSSKAYGLAAKICSGEKLSESEQKQSQQWIRPDKLNQVVNCHPVLQITLATCLNKVSQRKTILMVRLEAYVAATCSLNKQSEKLFRHAPSYAWKNGNRGNGDKDGVYKFS